METQYQYIRARASWRRDAISLSIVSNNADEFEKFSQFTWYVHSASEGTGWGNENLDMWVVGITSYHRPGTERRRDCVISAEGDVAFIDDPVVVEKIPGAGIESPDSKYHGRMNDIRGIGASLFACGDGGQIYQRLANGQWINLAPELLVSFILG